MKNPIVPIPSLSENDFCYGADDSTADYLIPTMYAKHPMAGYPRITIDAFGSSMNFFIVGRTLLGRIPAWEYYEPESEFSAFVIQG